MVMNFTLKKIERINRIKNKISWSLIGNTTYAISQWLLITILARMGTLDDLGIYSLALAINAPIILFFNFQLRTLLATEKIDEKQDVFQTYFAARIIHLLLAFIIVSITTIIFVVSADKSIYNLIIILAVSILKVFEALSDICLGYLQRSRKINVIGRSQFIRALMTIIVFGVTFIVTKNLFISLIGIIAVMAIRLYKYDLYHVKKLTIIRPKFSNMIFTLTKVSFPLGVVSLINSLNTNIPKYLLEFFNGTSSVGVYSALAYLLVVGNLVISPISLLAAPKLTSLYNESIEKFTDLLTKLCIFSTFIFLVMFSIVYIKGDLILELMYGVKFVSFQKTFMVVAVALLFSFLTTFVNLALVVTRTIKIQPIINLMTTMVAIFSGIFFIKTMGISGAALTLLITRITQTILSAIILIYTIRKSDRK